MVFGEMICQIFLSSVPAHIELSLFHPVSEPTESHVGCLASVLFKCFIDDTMRCVVVSAQGGGRLWVT